MITDHPFVPSKRKDSCAWTDWSATPWTVCDYPQAQHVTDLGCTKVSDAPGAWHWEHSAKCLAEFS